MNETVSSPSFWENEPDSEFPEFLSPELKQRIVDEQLDFRVISVRDVKTEYGETWMLEVEFEGERWTLPLSHNPTRDAQIDRLNKHVTKGQPVACGLGTVQAKAGRAWVLTPPSNERFS